MGPMGPMVQSGQVGGWPSSRWICLVWLLAAAACHAGCAAPPERGALQVGPGTRVGEMPGDYGLVIGRIAVSVGGEPLLCPSAPAQGECRLVFRYQGVQALSLPLRSSAELGPRREPAPFYVIRLPKGDYDLFRFEGGGASMPSRFRDGVSLRRSFTLRAREALYVGSLYVDLPAGQGALAVRMADESALARDAADDLEPGLGSKLVIRLAEESTSGRRSR